MLMDQETEEMLISVLMRDDVKPLFDADLRAEHARMMLEYAKPDSPPSWLYFIEVAAMDNVCQQWGFVKGWYADQHFGAMDPVNGRVN